MTSKPSREIAVIIAACNAEAYIAEALESVLRQTLKPVEIVVVDDASEDKTVDIVADKFGHRGVELILLDERAWMAKARNIGAAATTAPLLMFWDADDIMPDNFLAQMAGDLKAELGMVYCGRTFFGEGRPRSPMLAPAADRVRLWKQNFCPSPMLMRRAEFEAAGRWIEPPVRACPDWHLALRLSGRCGWGPSMAMGKIRRHSGNHTLTWAKRGAESMDAVRMDAASITVACIYGGRLPGLRQGWLDAVRASVLKAGKRVELIIVDGSTDGWGGLDLDRELSWCHTVTVKRARYGVDLTAVDRRKCARELSTMLAAATNDLRRMASGDILWLIEDDLIVPENACVDMLKVMLGQGGARAAVTGMYRSRHNPTKFLAANIGPRGPKHLTELPAEPGPIDLSGTGCLMLLRDLMPSVEALFRGKVAAHDWALSDALASRGNKVWMVANVVVPHYQTEEVCV